MFQQLLGHLLPRLLLAVNVAHLAHALARRRDGRVVREVGRARPHAGHARVGRDAVDGLGAAEFVAEVFLFSVKTFWSGGDVGGRKGGKLTHDLLA